MNGLRQLRDATGAHQVGWRSPTVDDNDANQMPNKRVVVVRLIAICVSVAVEAIIYKWRALFVGELALEGEWKLSA